VPDNTSAEHLTPRPKLCQVDTLAGVDLTNNYYDQQECIAVYYNVSAILVVHWTCSNIEQSFAGNQFIVIKMHVLEVVHQLETL
jgi:hypothetical protein